jgi:hypothetical protein
MFGKPEEKKLPVSERLTVERRLALLALRLGGFVGKG